MQDLRITSIQKVGNSLGVIIPAYVARALDFQRGEQVIFAIYNEGVITLRKITEAEKLQMQPPIIHA